MKQVRDGLQRGVEDHGRPARRRRTAREEKGKKKLDALSSSLSEVKKAELEQPSKLTSFQFRFLLFVKKEKPLFFSSSSLIIFPLFLSAAFACSSY